MVGSGTSTSTAPGLDLLATNPLMRLGSRSPSTPRISIPFTTRFGRCSPVARRHPKCHREALDDQTHCVMVGVSLITEHGDLRIKDGGVADAPAC